MIALYRKVNQSESERF